jgi:large subunit ribosomal protein L13
MKTYSAKPTEVVRKWHLIDASTVPLGRLASEVAVLLSGKHKPMYTSHIDCGDWVVVVNARELVVTGTKEGDKKYYHHSQYPGGLRERTLAEQRAKDPTKVITEAVRGMLPANKLRPERLKRLKVYPGSEHKHEAQQPKAYQLQHEKKVARHE